MATALGFYDNQYTAEDWPTQAARLGIALGGLIAIAACGARLDRERRLRELSAHASLAQTRASDAEGMAGLAEWLQRSLLTDPPQLPDVEIVALYVPAADHVKIGGDWYDAFPVPEGRTMVVIGDVAGHDGAAAATMAQVRSMLRGIGQVLAEPPARLLTALDHGLCRVIPGALATMILAEVGRDPARAGMPLVLRWANAGHPPPLLLSGAGLAELLEHDADLLLGVDPDTRRVDHERVLQPGDTVVLFTDGLVERRGTCIDDGLQRMHEIAGTARETSLETLCDLLLAGQHGPPTTTWPCSPWAGPGSRMGPVPRGAGVRRTVRSPRTGWRPAGPPAAPRPGPPRCRAA